MRHALAALLPILALTAQPAAALSCMKPDMFQSLEMAHASPEANFVFVGSLTTLDATTKDNGDISMRLTGIELTANGAPIDIEAMGRVACVGEWCGEVADVEKGVFFGTIDSEVGPLVITFDPCASWVFADPDPEAVADLGDTLQRMQREDMERAILEDAARDGVASAQRSITIVPLAPALGGVASTATMP